MDKKPSNIKERVLHFVKIKGITQLKLCEIVDMSHGSFKGEARKTPLNSDAIANLFSVFKDLNLDWLFSGEGEPLKKNIPEILPEDEKNYFLVKKIIELTRENEQLRMENRILLNQSSQTEPKPYVEPEEVPMRAADPAHTMGKPQKQKKD